MRVRGIRVSRLTIVIVVMLLVILASLLLMRGTCREAECGRLTFKSATNAQGKPLVHFYLFYGATCPHCHEVMTNYLPGVYAKYGDQLERQEIDVWTAEDQLPTMLALEEAGGVPADVQGMVPALVIGDQVLVGSDEIPARLETIIDQYLAQGGASYPEPTGACKRAPIPHLVKPVHIAYFGTGGCQKCRAADTLLAAIKKAEPNLGVTAFDVSNPDDALMLECLGFTYGVPDGKRLLTPAIFLGSEDYLIGPDVTYDNIVARLAKYAKEGAEPLGARLAEGATSTQPDVPAAWEKWTSCDVAKARQSIKDRFLSFKAFGVLGAGLIDGLNPCAFATLVFFISYMALTGRRGRDILLVGIAFALGVFLTYFLVGLGLLKAIQKLSFISALGKWIYVVTAILCMVLAAFTLSDYSKARKGRPSEMSLKLPLRLRQQINKVIREGAQVRAFAPMALVTGFVVSLIELVCTGQVYFPTITLVVTEPDLASKAVLYLLLYCVMFIIPLIVVFVLAYFGTTSEQFGAAINRHTATVKLLTGLLFAGLAAWMAWAVTPLFGICPPWNWLLLVEVLLLMIVGAVILARTKKPVRRKPAPRRRKSPA